MRGYLFPFLKFKLPKERLDWSEAKTVCDSIKQLIEKAASTPEREEKIQKLLKEFSPPAIVRLREHVGFVLAKKEAGAKTRAQQEKWFSQNQPWLIFEEHFHSNSPLFQEAVQNFSTEIDRQ